MSTQRSGGPDLLTMCKAVDSELTRRCRVALAAAGYPGLRPSHWRLLRLLAGEPRLTGELATIMGITNQGVSKLGGELIDLGVITQRFDSADRRLRPLTLTHRGHHTLQVLTKTRDQLRLELAASLGGEQSLLSTLTVLQQVETATAFAATDHPRWTS